MLSQAIVSGLIAGSTYGLVALGFSLIYRTVHFFHFAHGAVYTVGAYCAFALLRFTGLPLILIIFLAITASALLGGIMELCVYRPMRQHAMAPPLVMLLASLGMLIITQNAISLVFGAETQLLRSNIAQQGHMILGARFTTIQAIIVIVNISICLVVWAILRFSIIGLKVRALMNDHELARIVGVQSEQLIFLVFIIGSALAGLAGILIGFDLDLSPTAGFRAIMMSVVAVIVGGIGSTLGAITGGLVVGLLQNFSAVVFSVKWQDTIVFTALILFLLIRPQGLLGKPLSKAIV